MAGMKEKQYVSNNAQLMDEWDWEKNNAANLNPYKITYGSRQKAWWLCSSGHSYDARISNKALLNRGCPICSGKKVLVGVNDLETCFPDVAQEWDYSRNGDLTPKDVVAHSNKKVWWKCSKCGNSWEQDCNHRTGRKTGCPYCSGRVAVPGVNDLYTVNPTLAKEWHPSKNLPMQPANYLPQSNQKVWWVCSHGHEWEASIKDRYQGTGCPICAGREVLAGFNDLQTTHPQLIDEWDFSKNTTLGPTEVSAGSHKKVWWICSHGHEWKSTVSNRSRGNRNCPICSNQKLLPGYNDLETTNPALAKEWNSSKNGELTPRNVFQNTNKKVWWVCRKGHEQFIQLEKENSIAVKNPALAQEWHPTKNGKLQPDMVSHQSNNKFWWLGKCGHEWYADPAHRMRGRGCPYCCNNKVLQGFNDLETTNPDLVREWDYAKNVDISPNEVTQGSNKKVWWICEKGHKWQATISSRNSGNGCPYCSGRLVLSGYNDLLSVYPHIAKEWHPQNNGDLRPSQISSRNRKKVWWLCSKCGYEWETRVVHRANGHGCPRCAKRK